MISLRKPTSSVLLTLLIFTSTGCSFPGVHKIPVQQGNHVTQEMVDTLKIGMTAEQVEYVLGSPLAVNPFDSKRWEYHYSLRRGADIQKRKHLVIVFDDNGQLADIKGDYPLKTDDAEQPSD